MNFVKTHKLVSLSEQELVDCDKTGPNGDQGYYTAAYGRRFGGGPFVLEIHRISAMDWEFSTPANPNFFDKTINN